MRAIFLIVLAAFALSACRERTPDAVFRTPRLHAERLDQEVGQIADRARPALLGVGVMNLETGEIWAFNGERPFPMQSVVKAPLGAAVLAEVDAGRLSLDEVVTLAEKDISPPRSPIADAWPARGDYTVRELLVAAAGGSDNTAADVLMKRIGGPGAITAWLRLKRVEGISVDRYEREFQVEAAGMESFRIAWKDEDAFSAALAAVRPERRAAAMRAYLTDPRDTATPRAALNFLQALDQGRLVSPASRELLLDIMTQTGTGQGRLKAGFPSGSIIAHKTGTGRTDLGINPASNDIGIVTLPDGRRYAVAVFLSGSPLDDGGRDEVIADVARAVARGVR